VVSLERKLGLRGFVVSFDRNGGDGRELSRPGHPEGRQKKAT